MANIVNIYTDGSSQGNNPIIGGWGTVLEATDQRKEICDGVVDTTNNRMEILAVIQGFKCLKAERLDIKIFSDSAYVVNCFQQNWYKKWEKNGWINSQKKPVENKDLWVMLLSEIRKHEKVVFYHVDGHINPESTKSVSKYLERFNTKNNVNFTYEEFLHIVKNNNRADELADEGAKKMR